MPGQRAAFQGAVASDKQLAQPEPAIMHVLPPRPQGMGIVELDVVLGALAPGPVEDAPAPMPNPVPTAAPPAAHARIPGYGRSLRITGPGPVASTVAVIDMGPTVLLFSLLRPRS